MKKNTLKYLALLPMLMLLMQCQKTIPELTGSASVANFEFVQKAGSDTLPYPYTVQFTNKSQEEFLYQWDFGDNSNLSPVKDPAHTYKIGGVYDVRLTSVGTNGNNSVTKKVFVASACTIAAFNDLTKCATGEWTWSLDGDAIKVLSPDATQVYFAGAAAPCQADDIYKFNADGSFVYDANGQTFDVQSGYSCQAPKANAPSFKMVVKPNQNPQILLSATSNGVGRPFIGTTDVVEGDKYQVMSITPDQMVLRAVIENNGGVLLEIKLKRKVALNIDDIKLLLNGTNGKSWKLDGTDGAKAVIVGTENNPSEYFGGGPLADCQIDDIYTFTPANRVTYNANGSTFNGGNIAPNFNCGDNRSYSNNSYTFGPVTGGRVGLATIQLSGVVPDRFIGVTDVPAENTYRIIDISPTRMTLRAGNGSGTVFQFKMVAQ